MMGDKLFVKSAPPTAKCIVHDAPEEGLARLIVREARRLHGKGGANVCVRCIERAKRSLGVR